eukprot:CAMPEP_0170608548 /NCGR_PEP_ID=MMETSP0224-20130122/21641_1 /TAXON_ID=285029 /ORGANISM="Togula jolla, Strain CCCM 725" /LENGTH=180 /DNA_ID=CAMNT_0010933777 /DNA_START=1 /DNA_END=540 /DNA_ORIENTATION=-
MLVMHPVVAAPSVAVVSALPSRWQCPCLAASGARAVGAVAAAVLMRAASDRASHGRGSLGVLRRSRRPLVRRHAARPEAIGSDLPSSLRAERSSISSAASMTWGIAVDDEELEECVEGLRDWLWARGLERHFVAVNEWCREMGPADFVEVADNRDDLAEYLGKALTKEELNAFSGEATAG